MKPAASANALFRGVIPVLVTPFRDDEAIDLESLRNVVEFMGRAGVNAVTVLGVFGEADRLADAERSRVIETTVASSNASVPVIVGVGHAATATALEQCKTAAALGAHGILAVPPRDTNGNESAIFEFYRRLAEATTLPICIQDHPASSGVSLPVPLLLRLVEEVPGIAAVKVEAVPSLPKIAALVEGMTRRGATLLAGLGALSSYFELQSGADGLMTGFAFPEVLVALFHAMQSGRADHAFALYQQYLPLIVLENHYGVPLRKEVLRQRGLLVSNRVRHPGASVSKGACQQLQSTLTSLFPGADLSRPLVIC